MTPSGFSQRWALRLRTGGGAGVAAATLITLMGVTLYALRLMGPNDLGSDAQSRVAGYVLDLLANGDVLVQVDVHGAVMSKPPLHNWMCGVSAMLWGAVDRFSLTIPSLLCTIALALLVYFAGRHWFGARAGLCAAVIYLGTSMIAKQIALVRADASFSLFVTGAAVAAFAAWKQGRSWVWFWLLAALATLAKGPLGLVLGAAGLLALFWEKRSWRELPAHRSQAWGVLVYLAVVLAWFVPALLTAGEALYQKQIESELIGHALFSKGYSWENPIKPTLYLLSRLMPWTGLLVLAGWRVWARPAEDPMARAVERFLFAWLAGGLVVFSLASHQRADHLMPLIPAAALLAGREVVLLARMVRRPVVMPAFATLAVAMVVGMGVYQFTLRPNDTGARETLAMQRVAAFIREQGLPHYHVDSPAVIQVFLGSAQRPISAEAAAELLASNRPVLITISDTRELDGLLRERGARVALANEWMEGRKSKVHVLSNVVRQDWASYTPEEIDVDMDEDDDDDRDMLAQAEVPGTN